MAASPDVLDSKMLYARAEQCRSLAAGFRDPEMRTRMLQLAIDYADMASEAEQRNFSCSPALKDNKA